MNTNIRLIAGCIISLLLAVFFLMTYFTVAPYERVIVTRFGKISYVADPGLHFKFPFVNSTTSIPTDIQEAKPDQKVNTYTVDNQEVDVMFNIFYRVPITNVEFVYTNVRDYKDRLLTMGTDRLKAEMGQVNVSSVAEKRGELRDKIKNRLATDAKALGVEVTDLQLSDLQYTDSYRTAISTAASQKAGVEGKEYLRQQAEKEALTAQIKATGEANGVRETARGNADGALLVAIAKAKAIQLQGEAEALAIKAQADALKANPNLVDLRKAERWNGALPTQMFGSAPIPFLPIETVK